MFFVNLVFLFTVVYDFLEYDGLWTLVSNGAPEYYNAPWEDKMKLRTEWEAKKQKIEAIASLLGTTVPSLIKWYNTIREQDFTPENWSQEYAEWAYENII